MEDDQFPFSADFQWKGKIFLGEGSYGRVFKVKSLKDGQFYAIKQLKMDEFNRDPSLMTSLKGEIAVTSEVKSPFIVQLIASKIGHKFTYMILELCDSDLRKELAQKKNDEPKCVEIFDQIMKGFQELVGKGYIHRDIKPANVLVKNNIHKVADFGFACKADILCRQKLTEVCGTPIYMAPQLLKNEPYTAKSDVWSLGLMLYEMIFGYPPWPCRSLDEYLNGIYTIPLRFPYNGPIGQNTKDFIRRSLVIDEGKRMTWKQVFEHPLIKQKNVGSDVPSVQVGAYVKKLLLNIQNNIQRKQININSIIAKYKTQKVNKAVFSALIKEIEVAITSYQIDILFGYLDTQKLGFVSWSVVEEKVLNVDFRQHDDVLSRKVDEIVAILNARKQNLLTVFDRIDTNHTKNLDYTQFTQFIRAIAPKYTSQEILQLFGLFDTDKSKLISKQEFIKLLAKKMPSQQKQKQHTLVSVRGKRNLQNFLGFIKWSNKSAEKIIQQADMDRQQGISKTEFQNLLNKKFGFTITKEEIDQVFHIIDASNNGTITYEELTAVIK